MDNTGLFRAIGTVLIIVGIVLVSNPELISSKPIPDDTFRAIERRIWWGLLIGIGTLLLFRHQVQPWLQTLAATSWALIFGVLVVRLLVILLDGSGAKQWAWVAVEAVVLVVLLWWYRKISVNRRYH